MSSIQDKNYSNIQAQKKCNTASTSKALSYPALIAPGVFDHRDSKMVHIAERYLTINSSFGLMQIDSQACPREWDFHGNLMENVSGDGMG